MAAAVFCAPVRPAVQAARGRVYRSAGPTVRALPCARRIRWLSVARAYASPGKSVASGQDGAMGSFGFGAARLLAGPGGSVAAAAALVFMSVGELLVSAR